MLNVTVGYEEEILRDALALEERGYAIAAKDVAIDTPMTYCYFKTSKRNALLWHSPDETRRSAASMN